MTPAPIALAPDETEAVLAGALHELEGYDAKLETWTSDTQFTEYGKRRVVRFDLQAEVGGIPQHRRYQWLGKFYDRDEDARRVAAVLQQVASSDGGKKAGVAVPSVLGYHARRRLLLLTYEPGEAVTYALARDREAILTAIGRTLATLHGLPIAPNRIHSPNLVLEDLRPRVGDLCRRFPTEAESLRSALRALERDAASVGSPTFVHGDFGPANLLWRDGRIVVLDFDKCARGDPAFDLGNLFAQLFRMSIKKPKNIPDLATALTTVLDAYRRSSRPDPELEARVAWYERATLLRKIHGLIFSKNRSQEPEAVQQRHTEAVQLLRLA